MIWGRKASMNHPRTFIRLSFSEVSEILPSVKNWKYYGIKIPRLRKCHANFCHHKTRTAKDTHSL